MAEPAAMEGQWGSVSAFEVVIRAAQMGEPGRLGSKNRAMRWKRMAPAILRDLLAEHCMLG
jgi:hypothetical protein